MSFRREKYVPKGGPDGGDGGDGGSVFLVGDAHQNSLVNVAHKPHKRAENGKPGEGSQRHGADGADLLVKVPLGTLVYEKGAEDEVGKLIADLSEDGQRVLVAEGGRGGLGNEHFKSASNQAPREATPGQPWVERTLRLELRVIADVGLVGMPNAGKSTLLRAISSATPKVAAYPFTTLNPHLGMADLVGHRRLLIADIPGLIEGAAAGAGLGHDFLKHIERTKVIVHLLDIAPIDGSDPVDNYHAIRSELHGYDPAKIAEERGRDTFVSTEDLKTVPLADKVEIIALNKADLIPDDAERERRIETVAGRLGMKKGERPIVLSAATGAGTKELLEACWAAIHGREAVFS